MKMTIITDESGQLVGAMQGHAPRPDPIKGPESKNGDLRAGLVAGPGQRLHEVDIPDAIVKIQDPDEFGDRLMKHVLKEGLLN